ncbi:uncharacterized protein LOC120111296 [Phoenix dactylifera]|uniref:Uncharacterized protein LOC120111296 n=1 Tax=Phoenix dactylifera TaxID=42345 RepID=A0A8B9ABJ1_PHODC|nr:uncharacterized protein LOC120111296 [Phoenix dactylifera]
MTHRGKKIEHNARLFGIKGGNAGAASFALFAALQRQTKPSLICSRGERASGATEEETSKRREGAGENGKSGRFSLLSGNAAASSPTDSERVQPLRPAVVGSTGPPQNFGPLMEGYVDKRSEAVIDKVFG